MNYTKSGILAQGAPHSRVRYYGEATQGWEHPSLLLLTEEGTELAKRFYRSIGCNPNTDEERAELLNKAELTPFLAGVLFALNLP